MWLKWGVYTFRHRQFCPSTCCVTYVRSVHVQTQAVLSINKLCDLSEECTRSDTGSPVHQQAVWLKWGVYTFRHRQSCPSTSCVTYVRSSHVQTQTVLSINKLCDLRLECTRSDTDSLPVPESAVGSPSSFSASTSDRPASRWGFCATAEGATAPVNKWNAEFKSGIHFTPANIFYTSKESKMRLGYGGQPINGIYGNNRSLVWESLEVWKFTVLAKFTGFYVTEAVTCSYHCCRNG